MLYYNVDIAYEMWVECRKLKLSETISDWLTSRKSIVHQNNSRGCQQICSKIIPCCVDANFTIYIVILLVLNSLKIRYKICFRNFNQLKIVRQTFEESLQLSVDYKSKIEELEPTILLLNNKLYREIMKIFLFNAQKGLRPDSSAECS